MRTTIKETLNPDGTVAVRETTYEEESIKDKLDELIAETRRLADRPVPAQYPVWMNPYSWYQYPQAPVDLTPKITCSVPSNAPYVTVCGSDLSSTAQGGDDA